MSEQWNLTGGYTPRYLSRFIARYESFTRKFSAQDKMGVFKNIQRALEKGLTVEDIESALREYEANIKRRQTDPRFTKHVRSFFTYDNLTIWKNPLAYREDGARPNPVEDQAILAKLKRTHEPRMPLPQETHEEVDI